MVHSRRFLAIIIGILACLMGNCVAALAGTLSVTPDSALLSNARAYRQFVLTDTAGGAAHDVTQDAVCSVANPKVAAVRNGRVTAKGNGKTILRLTYRGQSVAVPIIVSRFAASDPVNFKFETLPVLTKQGCATGSCHGSPHGKGGFSLSLYGYDPNIDRISLTRDGYNRRIDALEPTESLMLKKPLLELPHVGGKRLRRGDAAYRILTDWIYEGANTDLPETACARLVVTPGASRVLHAPYLKQQISVLASFTNGSSRDVSAIATYDTSNANVATVDADGLVTGHNRGQAAISVRYLDKLQSLYITVVEDVPGFAWKPTPENNIVDKLVDAKLRQLQYLPSGGCDDATFLRRVSLDLTGLLPTAEKTRRFLKDTAPDKRAKRVDSLLDSEEYAHFQAMKKGDLMRLTPARLKDGRAEVFAAWLTDAFRKNKPYDQFAREILTAKGDSGAVPAANYFLAISELQERTEMTAQLFMGTRIECARCHNHPFEAWTMRDYYSISAVFARTQADAKTGFVKVGSAGEAYHPTTGEAMKPYGAPAASDANSGDSDRREGFAAWLTGSGNPYFARVEVNRMWADLMGRGIVEPVDDFRSSNPPANVSLLDTLAREFEASGYDRKHILRLICNSRTYQRSAATNKFNETDDTLFSHARIRLLTAEQLKDAIGYATQTLAPPETEAPRLRALKQQFARLAAPPQSKESLDMKRQIAQIENCMDYATQRPYPEDSQFTLTFGQPRRESACTCERQNSPTLLQALELLNGGTAERMAENGAKRYTALDNPKLIEELYLSALCRFPTEKERTTATHYLAGAKDRNTAVMDLVWTLTNTQEFLFQH